MEKISNQIKSNQVCCDTVANGYVFNTNKEYNNNIPWVSYIWIKSESWNTKYINEKQNMSETTSKETIVIMTRQHNKN